MIAAGDVMAGGADAGLLERLIALCAVHGATDTHYLRAHFPRFVATRDRLYAHIDPRRGGRMLDVGAHWLHQSLIYALDGFEVTALDVPATFDMPAVRALAQAHAIHLLPNPDLEQAQALAVIADDTFDIVLLTEVIEHLAFNPVTLWREIHRVMKAGARVVITTPNYHALRASVRRWLRAVAGGGGGVPVEDVLSLRTHAHHWKEYSRRELVRYFRLLSPDFACRNLAYTQEYLTAIRARRGGAFALWLERWLPPLRPDLYLEVELARKDRGVALEPHW